MPSLVHAIPSLEVAMPVRHTLPSNPEYKFTSVSAMVTDGFNTSCDSHGCSLPITGRGCASKVHDSFGSPPGCSGSLKSAYRPHPEQMTRKAPAASAQAV